MSSFNCVNKNYDILSVLGRSNGRLYKAILKNCSDETINSLCKICHKVLKGTLPIKCTSSLRKHRHVLRKMDACYKQKDIAKARKLLTQSGGGYNSAVQAHMRTQNFMHKLVEGLTVGLVGAAKGFKEMAKIKAEMKAKKNKTV